MYVCKNLLSNSSLAGISFNQEWQRACDVVNYVESSRSRPHQLLFHHAIGSQLAPVVEVVIGYLFWNAPRLHLSQYLTLFVWYCGIQVP
jgi:hypothetical protein